MLLSEGIAQYLRFKEGSRKSAHRSYKPWLLKFLEVVGDRELKEITPDQVYRYQILIKGQYSRSTPEYASNIIRNFFRYWEGETSIKINQVAVPTRNSQAWTAISQEEFEMLDDYFDVDEFFHLRNRIIVRLLWEVGLRNSELRDLKVLDIGTDIGCLIRTKKSNIERYIIWTEETHKLILKYLGILLVEYPDSEYLIVGDKRKGSKGQITAKSLQRIIKGVCDILGIERHIVPHSFRHGKAHSMLAKGASHEDFLLQFGHINQRAIESYLRVSKQSVTVRLKRFL